MDYGGSRVYYFLLGVRDVESSVEVFFIMEVGYQ